MLNFHTLFSLPTLLSTTLIAHALAAPRPDGVIAKDRDDPEVKFAAALTGGERCDDEELQQIRDGFAEMTQLFLAAQRPDLQTGQAELEFFGRAERIANFTPMIEGNLRRAAQYANLEGDEVRNPDVHVRCDDPMRICKFGNKREGEHVAYNIGNEPHVNFCGNYFKLDPLDKRVDKESMDEIDKPKLMEYYNRATAWARQVMHFREVGSAVIHKAVPAPPNSTAEWAIEASEGPMNISVLAGVLNERPETDGPNNIQALKYAYGVTRSKLLAVLSTQEPYDAANNAENYALYAQARYVMEKKGFYPNLPVMDFGNDMAVLTNEQIQEGERKRFAFYDVPDVVQPQPGMDGQGGPLRIVSSASTIRNPQFERTGPAALALFWAIACSFMLSAIG